MSRNRKTTRSFEYRMCLWIGKTSGQFPYFQGILSPVSRHFTIYHIFQTNLTIRRHIKTPCQLVNNASSSPTFFIIMEYVLSYHNAHLTFPLMIIIIKPRGFSRKYSVFGFKWNGFLFLWFLSWKINLYIFFVRIRTRWDSNIFWSFLVQVRIHLDTLAALQQWCLCWSRWDVRAWTQQRGSHQ